MKADRFASWLKAGAVIVFIGLMGVALVVYYAFPWLRTRSGRSLRLREWFLHTAEHADWALKAGEPCQGAPFLFPTNGYVGFVWGDSFGPTHRHQGIDIFSGTQPGVTPVVAAAAGYLTRLPDWKASLIVRIPDDPLQPGRQIWTYYTHMADKAGNSFIVADFPPGTSEAYVAAGTLLGYQGNYSGSPLNPTGVHLHFSIVLDDGEGGFRNELEFRNTIDPSSYLGLALNADQNPNQLVVCDHP
jgi:murein DD-endopeptidase MepM/ murein hydrolase activator NlpD